MKLIKFIFLETIFLLLLFTEASAFIGEVYFVEGSLRFAPENPVEGQNVRIYAVVKNNTDEDVKGTVIFKADGKQYGDPQPISLFAKGEDGVFVDVSFDEGLRKVKAYITDTDLNEKKESGELDIFVDGDADKDGIGNNVDDDDDNDGLVDEQEAILGTDPKNPDSDGDGVPDGEDLYPKNSEYSRDSDGDGLPDDYEDSHDMDRYDPEDAVLDQDNDQLSSIQEYELKTNPRRPDTDLDGTPDGWEVQYGLDPLDAGDALADSDVDSFTNREEYARGSDPTYPDPEGLEILRQEEILRQRRASPEYKAMRMLRNTIGLLILGLILIAAGVYRSKRRG